MSISATCEAYWPFENQYFLQMRCDHHSLDHLYFGVTPDNSSQRKTWLLATALLRCREFEDLVCFATYPLFPNGKNQNYRVRWADLVKTLRATSSGEWNFSLAPQMVSASHTFNFARVPCELTASTPSGITMADAVPSRRSRYYVNSLDSSWACMVWSADP